MIEKLLNNINASYTAYHTVKRVEEILIENGFSYLSERDIWKLSKNGKYYCQRNDSSLIAFVMGERHAYNIIAAHTDSPCFKLKGKADMFSAGAGKLNVETYGGPIYYSFLDRKLKIAGRAFYAADGSVSSKLIESDYDVIIPSVAIHLNREVNNGFKFNPQVDLCPITGLSEGSLKELAAGAVSYDLFLTCAEKGYIAGKNNDLICCPRLDDLEGVYGALEAFLSRESNSENIDVLALFDSEEIGSATRQGAGSTFLSDILSGIGFALGKSAEDMRHAAASSMIISLDNAHAKHPNHPEFSDPTTETLLGGGVVIKNHANYNYTTDAFSAAHLKRLFDLNDVKYQEFYSRSDIRCGSTLGVVNWAHLGIASIDLGLPQLAMHSAVETAAVSDYLELIKALKAFYSSFKI